MNCHFRAFSPSRDVPQVVDLYNQVFGPLRPCYSWPLTVERFTDKVLSHWEFRAEGLQLAFEADRLIGFILAAVREQPLMDSDRASCKSGPVFVSAIAVLPSHRRRGIGRELVARVADFAKAHGRSQLKVSANPMAPLAFSIGIQEDWRDAQLFFTAVGFQRVGTCQSMVRSIVEFRIAEPLQSRIAQLRAEGYECRSYADRDYAALVALLDDNGWPFWHVDMLSKIGRWTRTQPFMETCFLDCTTEQIYGPDEIGVVVRGGEILAFCAQTINGATGKAYLGPMLTAANTRGLGLGTAALQVSLELAARKGAVVCDLWTAAGEHMTHFYGKSGFQRVMQWFDYEKQLG